MKHRDRPSLSWLAEVRGSRDLAEVELRHLDSHQLGVVWGPALRALIPIADPPLLLHFYGAAPTLERPRVAVVGSRRASAVSRRIAFRLGRELGEYGVDVVSGLARGIDSAALEGNLSSGARPCAILGNGLPGTYPVENSKLAERIAGAGGFVSSELPLGAPPRRHHFPRRNRLISGISLGTVVVEAAARSGSLITVQWALEQGREVLAYPGVAEGPSHEGCHRLIRDGAALVTCARDVVVELAGLCSTPRVGPVARRVLQAIAAGADTVEGVMRVTGLSPEVVLRAWGATLDVDP